MLGYLSLSYLTVGSLRYSTEKAKKVNEDEVRHATQ